VSYVGEPVAIVIADSRYIAEDAVALVDVDYDLLPAVSDCRKAVAPGAPAVRRELNSNTVATYKVNFGDPDAAFAKAAHVFHTDLWQHRGAGHPIEGRGILAEFHPGTEGITAWASTQKANDLFQSITSLFDIDESKLRVITPEIGGGFGPKLCIYSEDIAVVAASMLLKRSIKWIEDRREHFTNAAQERDQYWSIDIAVSDDAKVLGIRGNLVHDVGAFALQDVNIPFNSASMMSGPYIVPSLHMDVVVAATNMTPVSSIRGAGYPQACVLDGADDGPHRARAEARPRRGAPPQSDPQGEDALHQAAEGALRRRHAIRQRRLSGLAGDGAQSRRLGRFPEAPGRGAGAGPLHRHRARARHQGHRARAVRVRHRAGVEYRKSHGIHRRRQSRPGPAHRAGADRSE
jgi:carbon-monoxide dehydrogenase large subunit